MKKVIAFVPCDDANLPHLEKLVKSLRKFHSEEELPLIKTNGSKQDPAYFYKATPFEAVNLLKEYEVVIKLDADQIITGDISHLWNDEEYDLGVVNNSNPREFKTYPYQFMGMDPMMYFNCGLVVMRNLALVEHWLSLCNSEIFNICQMREQDLMNIITRMNFKVRLLDSSEKWHGLISKGYGPQMIVKDNKIILPKNDEWPTDGDKEIVVLHWAGGADPNKGNYKIRYSEEVVKRLDELVS